LTYEWIKSRDSLLIIVYKKKKSFVNFDST
jgi:hypothetical protein